MIRLLRKLTRLLGRKNRLHFAKANYSGRQYSKYDRILEATLELNHLS